MRRLDAGVKSRISPDDVEALVFSVFDDDQKAVFEKDKEVDFSFSFGDYGRFRVNAFRERGNVAAALRLIPTKIRTLEEDESVGSRYYLVRKIRQGIPEGRRSKNGQTGLGIFEIFHSYLLALLLCGSFAHKLLGLGNHLTGNLFGSDYLLQNLAISWGEVSHSNQDYGVSEFVFDDVFGLLFPCPLPANV